VSERQSHICLTPKSLPLILNTTGCHSSDRSAGSVRTFGKAPKTKVNWKILGTREAGSQVTPAVLFGGARGHTHREWGQERD
jgi:hypothetical protein